MGDLEQKILLGIEAESRRLADLAALWEHDPSARPDPHRQTRRRARADFQFVAKVENSKTLGVRLELSRWCGSPPGEAAKKAAQRALLRLEEAGLVERHTGAYTDERRV
jgi:hypothetical protein